jgi:xylulokinase
VAAALGAAALAAVGTGMWKDFSRIDEIHKVHARAKPDIANVQVYERLLPIFAQASLCQSRLGDMLAELRRR